MHLYRLSSLIAGGFLHEEEANSTEIGTAWRKAVTNVVGSEYIHSKTPTKFVTTFGHAAPFCRGEAASDNFVYALTNRTVTKLK